MKYHPNPQLNSGFSFQQQMAHQLQALQRDPASDSHLDALLQTLVQFREALKSGQAVVPGERILPHRPKSGRVAELQLATRLE